MCEIYHLHGGWIRLSHGEELIIVFLGFYNSLGAVSVRNISFMIHINAIQITKTAV